MRGRPRQPDEIKVLLNNPGKRPLNKKRPEPKGKITIPASLTKNAIPIWKRVVTSMPEGVYRATDEAALAAYCEAEALRRIAATEIELNGAIGVGATGQPVASPWVKIASEQTRLVHTLGATLCLTPAARNQMMVSPKEDDDDPVE